MAYGNPYAKQAFQAQYKQNQIETATPEELLLLLYDGAIRFLNVAKTGLAEKNIEKFHNNILKTQRILTEFMCTLDMEIGGPMAQNLMSLYDYMHYTLVQANLKKDVTMIEEVLKHLRALKQTWEEAIRIAAREQQEQAFDLIEENAPVDAGVLSA
jgi:flagellar protein FliS